MAGTYDNTNSGAIFPNTRKETDSHPDMTGTINVGGTEYWISGWNNVGKPGSKIDGKQYIKLSVKPKEPRSQEASRSIPPPPAPGFGSAPVRAPAVATAGRRDDMDDEIPF